ncbi:MAG: hypothetical protein K8S99_01670 [Planctomycetes bacterium]|nr:hypothetical protein [Planctomycetota bacterium]
MRYAALITLALFLAACHSAPTVPAHNNADLVWREDAIGPQCRLVTNEGPPALHSPALLIVTHSLPDDPQNDKPIARALITRRDNQPLCTLGQLTQPGATLRFNVYRDPSTTKDVPPYTLPYLFLLIRHPDGSTSRLLWESPYNGYSPYKKSEMPPNGQWISLDLTHGTYWPQTDALNFNMNDGFQTLAKYASGFRATRGVDHKQSQHYSADSPVIAIGVGSGSGIPGHFVAYIDDIQLTTPAGANYLMTFPIDSQVPRPN